MRHLWVLLVFCLASPRGAWAVQRHSGEGLVAHQIAHLALVLALVPFAWRFFRTGGPGARLVAGGAALFGVWSLWAFAGHLPSSPSFLGRDHLVLVPAFFLLWRGLRAKAREERT